MNNEEQKEIKNSHEAIELFRTSSNEKPVPLNELIDFRQEIDTTIKTLQNVMQEQLIRNLKSNGISLEDFRERIIKEITPESKKPKPTKKPAKYRNPDDETQTWIGYGHSPEWFKNVFLTD
jgi:DNA-binding protein H-NS